MREVRPKASAARPWSPSAELLVARDGNDHLGARLWLETECCGGHRLWALNEQHLDYLERFVRSTQRDRDFPRGDLGPHPADRLPAWMTTRKHRNEVLRALDHLRQML